jgi:hypothetical protein
MEELNSKQQLDCAAILYNRTSKPTVMVNSLSEFLMNRAQRRIGEADAGTHSDTKSSDWEVYVREADEALSQIRLAKSGSQLDRSPFLNEEQSAHMADILW